MFKSGFIKLNKSVQKEVVNKKTSNERGVVYLGHVPHGFYENEMKNYFTQFGEVTNINIPKSKKTGRARGFAFVEFLYPEVAKVVAETMNNYLMHKKILVAKYLPPNQVKNNTFWRCNKNKIPLTIKNRSIQRKMMEKPLDFEQEKQSISSLHKRIQNKQKKLKIKGIEYDIQTYNPESSIETTLENNTEDDYDTSAYEPSLKSDINIDLDSDEDEIKVKTQKLSKKVTKTKKNSLGGCKLRMKS